MTDDTYYIAGDWGTSNLRLSLVNARTSEVVSMLRGPGINRISRDRIPATLDSLIKQWHGFSFDKIIISGMIGSNIGWSDAGYIQCPVSLYDLPQNLHHTTINDYHVEIVPGLCCENPLGTNDVMRGEELQILGALITEPILSNGNHLFCMPGTHCKWVRLSDGTVTDFLTGLSGELYALLKEHSVIGKTSVEQVFDQEIFNFGVVRSCEHADVDLMHLLFETRSRQLTNDIPPNFTHAFLSGLIIGKDIIAATNKYAKLFDIQLLIFGGESKLIDLYSSASELLGWKALTLEGNLISSSGIHYTHKNLSTENA